MLFILGNIFGGLSNILLVISPYMKTRKKMYAIQSINSVFGLISCILLSGYSGIFINIVSMTRNILEIKEECNKRITIVFVSIIAIIGIIVVLTTGHLWEFIPCIASIEYTTATGLFKNYKQSKIALIINELIWIFYMMIINNYLSTFILFIMSILSGLSLFKKEI